MRDPHVERSRRARQAWKRQLAGRDSVLQRLRRSRLSADQRYVIEAAGFWLRRLAPFVQRVFV